MFNRAYVEITDVCNLACSFCPGTRRPAGYMRPEDFRPAGGLVPEDGGLPLVGNADTGDAALRKARDSLCRGQTLRLPDLHGVMLYPTGLGIELAEGKLGLGHNVAPAVKHDGPGAGVPWSSARI